MSTLAAWIESTGIAAAIGQSLWLTAWLSAAHALGFTIIMGSGIVASLNAAGLLLRSASFESLARPAALLLALGLGLSLSTGLLLFAPRASYTISNGTFQLKILLLLCALASQVLLHRHLRRDGFVASPASRALGSLTAALWVSLALTACWFVLFE